MGQAVVDLPDPMQPPVAASIASTDDLLAQLAGEEIDRLLAGADAGHPAALEFPPVPPIDFSSPPADPVPIAPIDLNPASKAIDETGELDALLGQLTVDTPARTPDPQSRDASAGKTPSADAPTVSAENSVDEKLIQELDASESRARIVDYGAGQADIEQEAPLPLVLRPLEWMNAPLEALPAGVRDALGKVAILTLFNSLAVLIYLLVFRRHS